MQELQLELSELLAQRPRAQAGVASQCASHIHDAFYGTRAPSRGVNKFLELETALARSFSGLSAGAEDDFWAFAVLVVLRLAQETQPQPEAQAEAAAADGMGGQELEQKLKKKKKKKKKAQPNAPAGLHGDQCPANAHYRGHQRPPAGKMPGPRPAERNPKRVLRAGSARRNLRVRGGAQSLLASKKYTALIKLFTIFSSLEWSFESTIKAMAKSKDWSPAELLAKTFGGSGSNGRETGTFEQDGCANTRQTALLTYSMVFNALWQAHRIVYKFGLQEEFPDIERQRWQMALSFAGNDTSLQKLLFEHVVAAGEIQWAVRLAQILNIPDFESQVGEMVAQRGTLRTNGLSNSANAAALNGCLALELKHDAVVFCDTEESLHDAMDHFFGRKGDSSELSGASNRTAFDADHIIGLDVEWKPTSSKIAASSSSTTTTAVASNSLSNATSHILGRPLDKRMQMSNWDVRPLTTPQLTYAALDAYCLVQMTSKLHRDEDAELPTWQHTAAEIHDLIYSSPLKNEGALEAIALRQTYRQEWMDSKLREGFGNVVANLLTPQYVEEYWEDRKRLHQEREFQRLQTGGGGNDELLDTALTFLDLHTVKGLLEQSQDSDQPATFVAVNTICFFADEEPCVACIEANCKLDTAQLATLCGVSRRRIKLATPAECCVNFGFEPGTIPPFGHRSSRVGSEQLPRYSCRIRVFASDTLRYADSLVCGGGSHDALLWLNSKAYFALIDIEATGDIQRGVSAIAAATNTKEEPPVPLNSTSTVGHNRQGPIREYKFLADSMVARVGKWLRTIGMDVIIWDPYSVPKKTASQDHKAALLALSVCEQRILLTRDKKLANRRDAGACFVVSSDDPFKQFQEIKAHFALKLVKEEMMSRCSRCNAKGFDIVDLDYVRNQTEDEVHPNVLEVVTEFWVCRVCHKIYWEGPKYDSNYANLLRMFDEDSIVDSI
ncbi:hypothetical protein ON010_g12686 [Phytophthora cinnamomi]|nr:hypothetical protein ON010_g12686 [Phytophthora cinnamomi]